MTDSKKKKQSPEQMLKEIRERDKEFDDYVEKSKKMLEIKAKDHVHLKRQIILEAGAILEKNREKHNTICADLKREYKGYIHPSTVWFVSPKEWKFMLNTHKGENQYTNPKEYKLDVGRCEMVKTADFRSPSDSNDPEPDEDKNTRLSEQEKQYVQAFESEYKTNRQIVDFMEYWTGLSHTDQGRIMLSIEKGADWRKALVTAGEPRMLKLAKQATKSQLGWIQETWRTLSRIGDKVSDIFYEEEQLRESNKEMSGV